MSFTLVAHSATGNPEGAKWGELSNNLIIVDIVQTLGFVIQNSISHSTQSKLRVIGLGSRVTVATVALSKIWPCYLEDGWSAAHCQNN